MHVARPSDHPHRDETPAEHPVSLLERNGLEVIVSDILKAVAANKAEEQHKARLVLLDYLLEGQPPITEEEIEQARRECEE